MLQRPRITEKRHRRIHLLSLFILLTVPGLVYANPLDSLNELQWIVPIIVLGSITLLTVLYALIFNRRKRRRVKSGTQDPNETTSMIKAGGMRKRPNKTYDDSRIASGIGTGVVKIFQRIKENIGSYEVLRTGYRHLLDLACEQLAFDAGAIFLIEKDGAMRLCGYSGLRPHSQQIYSIAGKGIIAEIFRSDFPRFETNLGQIPGQYYDLFEGYHSAWVLPLMPQGKPIGIILLLHKEIPEHREDYFPKLDFVSIAVSWFYENHYNQMLIAKENRRTQVLIKTSLAISMSLDLNKVCNVLVAQLSRAYGCSFSYILLSENDNNLLYLQQYFSERGDPIFQPDERFIDISDMAWLLDLIYLGNPVLMSENDIKNISEEDCLRLKITNSKNVLISPLKYAGKFEGILVMVEQRSGHRSSMDQDVVNLTAAMAAQASAAIENARMYALLSGRVAHLSALFDVSQALNSGLDLIPFIDRVLRTISKNFHLSNCAFLICDAEEDELYVASVVGNYPVETIGKRFKLGEGVTGQAASTGLAINVGDVSKDSRFIRSTGETGSELAVPVILDGEIVGVLDIESSAKFAFSHREEELLKSIVDQVAVAIEKLTLKQQERERANKLAMTNSLVKRLSGNLDKSELLGETVKGIKEGFNYDLVAIFTAESGKRITLAHQSCSSGYGYETGLQVDPSKGLIAEVAFNKKGTYTDFIPEDEPSAGIKNIRSRYCIPLIAGTNFHGVLEIQDRKKSAVSEVDQSMLQTIAEFLSLTLNNVVLYNDILDKAERLTLAYQINQTISATLDLDELFSEVVKSLSESTGYYWATIVFKMGGEYRTSLEHMGKNRKEAWRVTPLGSLDKYYNEAQGHDGPVYYPIKNMQIDERLKQYFLDQGIEYLAISLINVDEKQSSFLVVGNPNSEGFRPKDKDLLTDISQHLGIAIKKVMLYSELKKAYNELAEAQDKLLQNEKFKVLGEISAGIAHDFKNILAAIMGRAQMLSFAARQPEGLSQDFLMKNVDIIEKSAADGVSILSRINDFTKSKNHIEFGEINIGDIISDTIEMTKPKWAHGESGKKIDVKFSSAGNLNLSGDRAMIVEVFSNLLHNAIDAIEAEGIIRISAYGNEEEIVAEVEDNGAGMDAQTLKKIFDPFFTTKSRQGTGLGLAMVYSIIDSHKGKITAESEIGKGTRFVIILPKHIDQNLSSALSVLVVEDDENLRNVLSELLDEINAKAMLAKNCHEALEILKCNRFDMVFTDLGLPDEDGWVIIDAVKESSPESFIVPMTGWNKEIERKELIARGLTNVLLKPFTLEQVSNLIDSYVQRKKDVHNIA